MTDQDAMLGLNEALGEAISLLRDAAPTWSQTKAYQDYVTDVDLKLDALLETRLSALTPGTPVLSEERAVGIVAPVAQWWIVDPLDGTGNLISGLPFVGIAVALVDAFGPRLAAVAAPYQDRVWVARRGGGATVNGRRLRIPEEPPSLVVASTGLLDRIHAEPERLDWRRLRGQGKLRNLGAQSLHICGVAEGWFGAALSVEARIWDEAAAGLILREAGGLWQSQADRADWTDPKALMDIAQQESLACHPTVHEALASVFSGNSDTPLLPRSAL